MDTEITETPVFSRDEMAQFALRRALIALGYSTSLASLWSSGRRIPSDEVKAYVHDRVGIPVAAWVDTMRLYRAVWKVLKMRAE